MQLGPATGGWIQTAVTKSCDRPNWPVAGPRQPGLRLVACKMDMDLLRPHLSHYFPEVALKPNLQVFRVGEITLRRHDPRWMHRADMLLAPSWL